MTAFSFSAGLSHRLCSSGLNSSGIPNSSDFLNCLCVSEQMKAIANDVAKFLNFLCGSELTRQNTGDSGKWLEDDHPRDDGGRFTSGGKSGEKPGRIGSVSELRLAKDEYAHVMSELNTHTTKEQREKRRFFKAIGEYIYYVAVDRTEGYDHFIIYDKIKLK